MTAPKSKGKAVLNAILSAIVTFPVSVAIVVAGVMFGQQFDLGQGNGVMLFATLAFMCFVAIVALVWIGINRMKTRRKAYVEK